MAVTTHKSTTLVTETPYQLDVDQTLRASQALLKHVQAEAKRIKETSTKRNLLDAQTSDSEEEDGFLGDEIPIWLNITTKQHIADSTRLKPSKIVVPHSLNGSEEINLCLITADPQRAVKDVVADSSFPSPLATKITKIIGFTKLKERYKTFEQRRQLLAEHDIFLADDRIITRLPGTLGKVFYKNTAKRPIPIRINEQVKSDGKRLKPETRSKSKSKQDASGGVASPAVVAKEIEKALGSISVNLKPGTSTAMRVGLASFSAQELSENISAVVTAMVEKHIAQGWKNVKAVHIKSPTSLSIPIWLADELWVEQTKVQDQEVKVEPLEGEDQNKRKRTPNSRNGPQSGANKRPKVEDTGLEAERQVAQARRSKLAAQKARIMAQ